MRAITLGGLQATSCYSIIPSLGQRSAGISICTFPSLPNVHTAWQALRHPALSRMRLARHCSRLHPLCLSPPCQSNPIPSHPIPSFLTSPKSLSGASRELSPLFTASAWMVFAISIALPVCEPYSTTRPLGWEEEGGTAEGAEPPVTEGCVVGQDDMERDGGERERGGTEQAAAWNGGVATQSGTPATQAARVRPVRLGSQPFGSHRSALDSVQVRRQCQCSSPSHPTLKSIPGISSIPLALTTRV